MPDTNIKPWYLREFLGRTVAFTIMELLIVMALLMTLSAIAMPLYANYIEEARITRVMLELDSMQTIIERHERNNNGLPASLDDLEDEIPNDPWGSPYQYLLIRGEGKKGKPPAGARKDKFLHPLNTDYDLCSMGPDGDSQPALTAGASRDDIIRADDGGYVGPASEY